MSCLTVRIFDVRTEGHPPCSPTDDTANLIGFCDPVHSQVLIVYTYYIAAFFHCQFLSTGLAQFTIPEDGQADEWSLGLRISLSDGTMLLPVQVVSLYNEKVNPNGFGFHVINAIILDVENCTE